MEKVIGIIALLFIAAIVYYFAEQKMPPSMIKTITLIFIVFVVIAVLIYAAWPYISRL